jgi:hypothetical protein
MSSAWKRNRLAGIDVGQSHPWTRYMSKQIQYQPPSAICTNGNTQANVPSKLAEHRFAMFCITLPIVHDFTNCSGCEIIKPVFRIMSIMGKITGKWASKGEQPLHRG